MSSRAKSAARWNRGRFCSNSKAMAASEIRLKSVSSQSKPSLANSKARGLSVPLGRWGLRCQ
ncbi:hypothetical protein THIOM_004796 [Candidatus Thiomargarita nelsonii]|uniref:Uncharacterized protein n=1 Tax=Candidatus Thiomargarita nelsonii TaxID=1003181 RepID=A0A176RV01_9GAMM|nr:hypothetical protein THIOM_004796 [Candidatus Thiomargarita nelsonii]